MVGKVNLALSLALDASDDSAAAPAPTSPTFTDIGGLRVHYSPSLGPAAEDQSGNAFHGAAGTGTPSLVATAINGKPGWRYVGASAQFWKLPAGIVTGMTAMHLFAVIHTTTNANGAFHFGESGSNNHHPFSDGNIYDGTGSTTRRTIASQNFDTPKIFEIISTGTEHTHLIDGVQVATTGVNTVAWPSTGVCAIGCGISTGPAAFGGFWDGDGGDLLAFGAKLSGANATIVRDRLKAWFGTA